MNEIVRPLAYRPKAAAAVLGVSQSMIYKMIVDGRLAARKIGATTVVPHDELAKLLQGSSFTDATKAAQASIK